GLGQRHDDPRRLRARPPRGRRPHDRGAALQARALARPDRAGPPRRHHGPLGRLPVQRRALSRCKRHEGSMDSGSPAVYSRLLDRSGGGAAVDPAEGRMMRRKHALGALLLAFGATALVLIVGAGIGSAKTQAAYKAAWIYVGPHNDGGW